MLFGCCTNINNFQIVENSGCDSIILAASDVAAMSPAEFNNLKDVLAQGSLEHLALNSFCPPELKLCGEGFAEITVENYIKPLAQRAAEIGIKQIGIGSPKSRNITPEFSYDVAIEQFKKSLTIICDVCKEYGIDILLEPVCDIECNFITKTDEALKLVEELNIDNLGICFDTYHSFCMGEDGAPLKRALKYVKLIHTAQNIDDERHYLRQENFDEYKVYFDVLLEAGYDGEVSVEAFVDDIKEQLPVTLAITKSLCKID